MAQQEMFDELPEPRRPLATKIREDLKVAEEARRRNCEDCYADCGETMCITAVNTRFYCDACRQCGEYCEHGRAIAKLYAALSEAEKERYHLKGRKLNE